MESIMHPLFRKLEQLSRDWITHGLPSRDTMVSTAHGLMQLRQQNALNGLWKTPPQMLTATLDDGIGQGIELISLFASVTGIEVISLGLLQKPEKIVAACRAHRPRYLGLTVLQMDSEDNLALVGHHLPQETLLIAGGPAFTYDPDLASRCGVHATATDVAYFIDLLLKDSIAPASVSNDGSIG